MWQLWCKKRTG